MNPKPQDHRLYWVYAWDAAETQYNFDTTTRIDEARRLAQQFLAQGWHRVYVFFGDEDGAFTDRDPALTRGPKGFAAADTIACGMCYPWAYRQTIGDPSGRTVLAHGTVTEPLSQPPKSYQHAWAERTTVDGILVLDWQTMEAAHGGRWRGKGYPRAVFFELFQPADVTYYNADEAMRQMLQHRHMGPWDD
jgi:hypothetical protein